MAKDGKKALTEEEALEVALRDHPQWIEQWRDDTLPETILDEAGQPMSPRMHIIMHTIIERQLSADDPAGVADIARALEQCHVPRHDIRHLIGGPLIDQLWSMQQEGRAFDVSQYLDDLQCLVDRQAATDDET